MKSYDKGTLTVIFPTYEGIHHKRLSLCGSGYGALVARVKILSVGKFFQQNTFHSTKGKDALTEAWSRSLRSFVQLAEETGSFLIPVIYSGWRWSGP